MTPNDAINQIKAAVQFLSASDWSEDDILSLVQKALQNTLLRREPWPEKGIDIYGSVDDGSWGYLSLYADGSYVFDTNDQPSREEILARWGYRLENVTEMPAHGLNQPKNVSCISGKPMKEVI